MGEARDLTAYCKRKVWERIGSLLAKAHWREFDVEWAAEDDDIVGKWRRGPGSSQQLAVPDTSPGLVRSMSAEQPRAPSGDCKAVTQHPGVKVARILV